MMSLLIVLGLVLLYSFGMLVILDVVDRKWGPPWSFFFWFVLATLTILGIPWLAAGLR